MMYVTDIAVIQVYPAHRLDRQTGGVLIFALDSDVNSAMQQQFLNCKVQKTYITLVRGFTHDAGTIDYALKTEKGTVQEALTTYSTIRRFEVPIALGKFSTSRYSLVRVTPRTGRNHQIRRHFAHIAHPIIGDRRHGCHRQNNLFRDHDQLGLDTMLLHASLLTFSHPMTGADLSIGAELQSPFQAIVDRLDMMSPPSDLLDTSPPCPPSDACPAGGAGAADEEEDKKKHISDFTTTPVLSTPIAATAERHTKVSQECKRQKTDAIS